MGYYTEYELEVLEGGMNPINPINGKLELKLIMDSLKRHSGYDGEGFFEGENPFYTGMCKWYDWHKDLKKLSREFPNKIFKVIGHGEDKGDIWRAYFKNGLSQFSTVKFVFEKYDETKMTDDYML